MKSKYFLILFLVSAVLVTLIGIITENLWIRRSGEIAYILPMIGYYVKKLPLRNLNFVSFVICIFVAASLSFFWELWYVKLAVMGLWLGAYIFLVREAIKHTEYARGSSFTTLYFLIVVGVYVYLLFLHMVEIERNLSDTFSFAFYIIYYLNILTFAICALIYYLNSFSRKSVFFICLTLAFIFADVLRDMEVFYFADLSVEVVGTLIRFAAIMLSFLFFVTREKKLRLLHLV